MSDVHYGQRVVHDKPYYLKAVFNEGGRPKVLFRSDHSDDLEISIDDNGRLALRRASVEAVEAAAVLAG